MNIKRLSRILVCLVMVLSLLVTLSPLKAHATLVGALPVAVPVAAPLVLGAVIIGLGIMCATDAGVFDGIISKCQEALTSSGYVEDGKINVISYQGKSYLPSDTVEAVRSHLFEEQVVTQTKTLSNGVVLSAGETFFAGSSYYTYTPSEYCNAFAYNMGASTTYGLIFVSDRPFSVTFDGTVKEGYHPPNGSSLYVIAASTTSGFWSSSDYYTFGYSIGNNGWDYCKNHAAGQFVSQFSTTKAVTLGNVAPDDEDLQTGYPGWYNNAVVIEGTGGTGGSGGDNDDNIPILGFPISAPELSTDFESMTQEEAQQPGDLVVEEPEPEPTIDIGGDTSGGSGISQTWLGENLAAIGQWLSGIKTAIIELPQKFATWFGDLITGIETLGETITNAWDAAIESILNGIRDIFVPSEDFLTEKVEALRDEFGFADSIITTFDMFRTSLFKFETSPPVIYVDLSNNRGPYDMGGQAAILDLRWYEEYKPTVDALISAFMWLIFVWRVGLHLPGTLRGASGEVPGSIVPSSEEKGIVVSRWIYDK